MCKIAVVTILLFLAVRAQHSVAQHSVAQHSVAQHSVAQHSVAQHGVAQHSVAQHSVAQHSVAQHSVAQGDKEQEYAISDSIFQETGGWVSSLTDAADQGVVPFQHGIQPTLPMDEDHTRMHVRRWRPFDLPTMGVQEGFALVGYSAVFAALLPLTNTGSGLDDLAGTIITTHMLASLIGAPLGVQIGGGIMGGNGTFLGSLAGGAAGSLLGLLTMYLTWDGSSIWSTVAPWLAASTLPSVVGYHISASPVQRYFPVDEADAAIGRLDPVTPRADVEFTVLRVAF